MAKYKRRSGDRKEGRLLRSLPAFNKFIPYIMPTRNDALNLYEENFDITELEKWIQVQRSNGYKGMGMLHFIIAAYIRGVSVYPGINRFVAGRRIYARDNIEIVMTVKRSIALDAPETTIKVKFDKRDNIYDVYKKMNAAIEEIKTNDDNNNTEDVAEALCHLPRFLLRAAIAALRVLDYFGWIPQKLLDASPFHGSMIITDLGSLRIGPAYHHIYNFGTLPVFIAFGAKRRVYELNSAGIPEEHKYIDLKMTLDERIADGYYFAQFLQGFRYIFKKPEVLESSPLKVNEDIK